MPRITKLVAQKRSKRVNVYLDGEYVTSLELLTVTKLGLKVGMDISHRELEKLVKTHKLEGLYSKAMHFLSFRPRSEKELRTYLSRKWQRATSRQEPMELIDNIIDKLKTQGLLDDQEFAKWWIQQRQTFRPKGSKALKFELRQKGIDRAIIEKSLAALNEDKAARRAAERKLKSFKDIGYQQARLKLVSFLKRRGFTWEVIKRVVDEMLIRE